MPAFRLAVQVHYWHAAGLGRRLLGAILANLGASPIALGRDFGPGHTSFLRLNYYPVTPAAAPRDSALGIGQHTDAGALTLLLQDEQPGLEVFKDNAWHLVEPRRDAIVVNIGDIVQVWSNDRYCAALHRVIASSKNSRYSIPYFMNPAYRTNYAPLPATVSRDRPARYREINWGEFRTLRADGDYADLGEEIQVEHYRISA
jgi:isopenicillin N synthase-like dioxygenase